MKKSISDKSRTALGRRVAEITRRLGGFIGTRRDFTTRATPVEMLVATILSQNTNDRNSYRAYRALRQAYPDWDAVADADAGEVAGTIHGGGLAGRKARAIIGALRTIRGLHGNFASEHFWEMSDDALIAELRSMPGVGLKTAACVLMFSLGRDVCPVDTHVHRVVNRLGIVSARTPDKSFEQLRGLIPKGKSALFHVGMIGFGRNVCKARHPHCFECPMYDICAWEQKQIHAKLALRGANPVSGDFLLTDNL